MAWEDKEMAGVLFRNDRKTSEKQPDWKGTCLVNGEPHELAAWEREGRKGAFLSFKLGPARPRTRRDDDAGDSPNPPGGGFDAWD